MAVMVVIEFKAKAGGHEDLLEFVQAEYTGTREARENGGCQDLTAYTLTDDPGVFVIITRWESQEHHRKYLAWRRETGLFDKLPAILDGPPTFRYFEQVSP